MICVWPRVKSAEPCVRGATPTSHVDVADVLGGSAVGTPLVDGDLLADELLVDRLGRLLDELLRQRVLDDRALAVDRRRADRERQLDRLDDPVEEQLALRRLELLRVLLGLGQGAQVVLELLAHVLLDDLETNASRGSCPAIARTWIWRRMSSSAESMFSSGASSLISSSTTAAGLAEAVGRDALADPVARAATRALR